MAGTFPSIYPRNGSLPIPGIRAMCCACPAKARWGKSYRVFLALQTFFLEKPLTSGPVQEAIERFVAERQFANHPITISRWERK